MTTEPGRAWARLGFLFSIVAILIAGSAFTAVVGGASLGTVAGGAFDAARATPSAGPPGAPTYVSHAPILIDGDAAFVPANGVTGGTGTPSDPYVIEGWEIDASAATGIWIVNTQAHAVVRDVFIYGGDTTYDGILLDTTANVVVQGTVLNGNAYGVVAYASTAITIADNRVTNSFWEGILVESSSFAVVRGNDVQLAGVYGIDVFGATDVEVRGNTAYAGWETGIYIQNVDRVIVTGNNASSNALFGIALDYASNATVIDNSMWDNDYGMDLFDSGPVLARQNTIGRSITEAVTLGYSNNVTIDLNRFVSNDGGLFASFATDLVVAHNTFDGNAFQGGDDFGTRTVWDLGYPTAGNFWSDYKGVDLCSGPGQDLCTGPDGIGDTPYAVDPDTFDRYPLMTVPSGVFPGSTLSPAGPSMLSVSGVTAGTPSGPAPAEPPRSEEPIGLPGLRRDTVAQDDPTHHR